MTLALDLEERELTRVLPPLVIMAQLALLLDLLFGLLSGLSELVARGISAGLLAGSLSCNIDMLGEIALLAAASGPGPTYARRRGSR